MSPFEMATAGERAAHAGAVEACERVLAIPPRERSHDEATFALARLRHAEVALWAACIDVDRWLSVEVAVG